MSGSVRIKVPSGVVVQVGINSGNVIGSPSQLSAAGGGNVFSAWVVAPSIDVDTIFYLTNHNPQEVIVPMKFLGAGITPNESDVKVPANSMVEAPASAFTAS